VLAVPAFVAPGFDLGLQFAPALAVPELAVPELAVPALAAPALAVPVLELAGMAHRFLPGPLVFRQNYRTSLLPAAHIPSIPLFVCRIDRNKGNHRQFVLCMKDIAFYFSLSLVFQDIVISRSLGYMMCISRF
jgi:hypothetical protein